VALILDTGPLYTALDRSDADHAVCRLLIEESLERLDRRHVGTMRPRHVAVLRLLPQDGT
jgi:hypothetical protein